MKLCINTVCPFRKLCDKCVHHYYDDLRWLDVEGDVTWYEFSEVVGCPGFGHLVKENDTVVD